MELIAANGTIYVKIKSKFAYKKINWHGLWAIFNEGYDDLALREFHGDVKPENEKINDHSRTHWSTFLSVMEYAAVDKGCINFTFINSFDKNNFVKVKVNCKTKKLNIECSYYNKKILEDFLNKLEDQFTALTTTGSKNKKPERVKEDSNIAHIDKFYQLVSDLKSGEISLHHLQVAYRQYIRENPDIPKELKTLLCGNAKSHKSGIIFSQFKAVRGMVEFAKLINKRDGGVEPAEEAAEPENPYTEPPSIGGKK